MSMTTTDPIADLLTRIRNAIAVNKTEIVLPAKIALPAKHQNCVEAANN